MTREKAKEICDMIETHGIEVIKAYGEGKVIQHMNLDSEWVDCDMPIAFVNNHSFRVKPEETDHSCNCKGCKYINFESVDEPCDNCVDSDKYKKEKWDSREYTTTLQEHFNELLTTCKEKQNKIEELQKVCQDLSDKFDFQVKQVMKLEEENAKLKAYNEKLLNGDIEKHNKIVELQNAYNETEELLSKQIEVTYKLDKENAELKEKLLQERETYWGKGFECAKKKYEEQLTYTKTIIQDLLNNSDEYVRQRAIDFLKGE